MLVIRFAKSGRRGERKYRIVVKEKRSKRDGRALDFLGWYEKTATGITKEVNKDKIKYWQERGAQLSPAIKAIL
ncbi:MAG TPA: 30S ribosomal protein S16 [Candidatus Levybacteria bacterium]|nr:30S ribosomal protein S16 [Candidatus Levybacteria bacterium]